MSDTATASEIGPELLLPDEMGAADSLAIAGGVPGIALMERASRAVFDAVLALHRERGAGARTRVVFLCGPGNNGGDGVGAAIACLGCPQGGPELGGFVLLAKREDLTGDAAEMAARLADMWASAGPPSIAADPFAIAWDPACLDDPDVVFVDALFGAGLSRDVAGDAARLIDAVNASRRPVIAVDIPSGIDGATGAARGSAIKAARTVTFFRRKPGHLLFPGRAHCGRVTVADIGIPKTVLKRIEVRCLANSPETWGPAYPWPRVDGHKYERGHAVVCSGPGDSTGAARLAARAGLRVGAGLVTVIGSASATAVNATQLTAVMIKSVAGADDIAAFLEDERRNAVLIGPNAGVRPETADAVLAVLASQAGVVLDADALTSFTGEGNGGRAETERFGFLGSSGGDERNAAHLFEVVRGRAGPVVMTPHEGEFHRLFPALEAEPSKLARARMAAKASGAIIVLKGADTVIAAPDGRTAINETGTPWLATAGSGDVLAGMVMGLMAQRMAAFEAACAAVWLHGRAAEVFGPGLIAEDLPEQLPQVLCTLWPR